MSAIIDTSVLVAAIIDTEAYHEACRSLIKLGTMSIFAHGLAETFSTLTGGKKGFRISSAIAAEVLEDDFVPLMSTVSLTPTEMLRAMREAESRGVRGGGIFDYLHLVAARKAKATKLYTLNISHFRAFHRHGDPEIVHP